MALPPFHTVPKQPTPKENEPHPQEEQPPRWIARREPFLIPGPNGTQEWVYPKR